MSEFALSAEAAGQHRQESLLTSARIRQLAAKLDVTPTKKLGQNFVHDPNSVRKIVKLSGVNSAHEVLEIGPGLGSLTLGLTETGARVTAVEIDPRLAAQLPQTVAQLQPTALLEVINADALTITSLPHEPEVLVANLPYNVSVPILMHLLENFESLRIALVMVQAEVGERIAAVPGSKLYGAPSVKAAWYGKWWISSTVSRNIFWPVPGVDSVLLSFTKDAQLRGDETERKLTFELINAAFGQRRKMLRQSLQTVSEQSLQSALSGVAKQCAVSIAAELRSAELVSQLCARCGVAATARAENLDVTDFHKLARALLQRA